MRYLENMRGFEDRVQNKLFEPVDSSTLGAFRILFGFVLFWLGWKHFLYDIITSDYIEPTYLFPFFDFIQPLPAIGLYILFGIWVVSTLFLAIGLYYRPASIIFFATFTYIFLLSKSLYDNYDYLIVLLSFLFVITGAHHSFSIDAKRRKLSSDIPYWQLFLFKFQFLALYLFAGVAKISFDWLSGEPARSWLTPLVLTLDPYMAEGSVIFAYATAGMLFDLFIGPLIWWKKTRWFAIIPYVTFHLLNQWLFHIGVFHTLAIAAIVLFLDPVHFHKVIHKKLGTRHPQRPSRPFAMRKAVLIFVMIYIVLQIAIPLRHHAIPGYVHWTAEGHYFAWQMKLNTREVGSFRISVTDLDSGAFEEHNLEELTNLQIRKITIRPHMVLQYVHYIRKEYEEKGQPNVDIRVILIESLNGRPFQYLIDPDVNLARERYNYFGHNTWILPLENRYFGLDRLKSQRNNNK